MDAFNAIAGIASIAGFALTIWTLWTVRELRQRLIVAERGRELHRQLIEVQDRLRDILEAEPKVTDFRPAMTEAKRASELLYNLGEKFGGSERQKIFDQRRKVVALIEGPNFDRDALYALNDVLVAANIMVEDRLQTNLLRG